MKLWIYFLDCWNPGNVKWRNPLGLLNDLKISLASEIKPTWSGSELVKFNLSASFKNYLNVCKAESGGVSLNVSVVSLRIVLVTLNKRICFSIWWKEFGKLWKLSAPWKIRVEVELWTRQRYPLPSTITLLKLEKIEFVCYLGWMRL